MTDKEDPYRIKTIDELRTFYDMPNDLVLKTKFDFLDDHVIRFIAAAPIVCVSSGMEDGLDVSPRGGAPGFVHVIDRNHVAIPDWPGNNKLETMTNILTSGRCGLLFLVPGNDLFLRINGPATVTRDPGLLSVITERGKTPKAAVRVAVREAYFHCGKAIKRSNIWDPESWPDTKDQFHVGRIMIDQAKIHDMTADEIQQAYEQDIRDRLY